MSLITRTYTFTDGTTAFGSQVDSEISNIVTTINNLDSGATTWTNVKVTTLTLSGNVNMGGFKLTNLGTPASTGDSAVYPITNSQISANTITNASIASQTIRGTSANSGGTAREISQGSIATPDLMANAVTQVQHVDDTSATSSAIYTQIDTKAITTIGGPVLIFSSGVIQVTASGSQVDFNIAVSQGGTTVSGALQHINFATPGATTTNLYPYSVASYTTLAAGTYTFKTMYHIATGSGVIIQNSSLTIVELRA